jgi:hypothetical protein
VQLPDSPKPWLANPLAWGSLRYLAWLLQRPYTTVIWWASSGALAAFGIRTCQDSSHYWHVEIPPKLEETPPGT